MGNDKLKKILVLSTAATFCLVLICACSGGSDGGTSSGEVATAVSSDDPLYSFQWHLKNTGQSSGISGEDINVEKVWNGGNKGEGVLVMVVDDGLEIGHPDLKANVKQGLSYNYTNGTNNPNNSDTYHGTCVGGIIAARDNNGIGVRGVAPRADLAGLNPVFNSIDKDFEDALKRNLTQVSVSNNSWGNADDQGQFFNAWQGWKTAIDTGVTSGKNGKGIVYVWAAGNGGTKGIDLSNYDGLDNYYGVISVCAVGDNGARASYSEQGANLWVCAPSRGGSGKAAITTTDQTGENDGKNTSGTTSDYFDKDYTKFFDGTSASAPIVSGVAALILNANANLSWRDVKLILAKTARKNDAQNSGWTTNAANIPINYSFGFGVVDASKAVEASKSWSMVGPQITKTYSTTIAPGTIHDGDTDLVSTLSVSGSGLKYIEYVEVTANISHANWGELKLTLRRSGSITTESKLSVFHPCYNSSGVQKKCTINDGTTAFTFGSSRHLDEEADGDWQLVLSEESGGTSGGTWNGWTLKIYGRGP